MYNYLIFINSENFYITDFIFFPRFNLFYESIELFL